MLSCPGREEQEKMTAFFVNVTQQIFKKKCPYSKKYIRRVGDKKFGRVTDIELMRVCVCECFITLSDEPTLGVEKMHSG